MNAALALPRPELSFLHWILSLVGLPLASFEENEEQEDGPPSNEGLMERMFDDNETLKPANGGDDDDDDEEEEEDDSDDDDDDDDDDDSDDDDSDDDDSDDDDSDDSDDDDSDDSERDYDNDDLDLEEEDEEDDNGDGDDDNSDEEESNDDESIARKQARENGRKLKETQTTLREREIELTEARAEIAALQEQVSDFNQVAIDPRTHPDFQRVNKAFWDDIDEATAEDLPPSASNFPNLATGYIDTYLKSKDLSGEERTQALQGLKDQIARDNYKFSPDFDALTEDEQRLERGQADQMVKDIMAVIKRNAPRAEEMIELEATLKDKSKKGRLAMGVKDYEREAKEFDPVFEAVGNLDEKLVEEDPYSIEAVVTQMVQKHPNMKKKLEDAKRDVRDALLGPKPLTQEQIEDLEAQGVDITEFQKERRKKNTSLRKKLAAFLVQHLMTRGITKEAYKPIAQKLRDEKDTKDELDALADIDNKRRRSKKKPKTKSKKPAGPASERPLAVAKFFDD